MNLIGWLQHKCTRVEDEKPDYATITGRLCDDVCAERLVRSGRYAQLLAAATDEWPADAVQAAHQALQRKMALVPDGEVRIHAINASGSYDSIHLRPSGPTIHVGASYVDRCAVTNAEFEQFVQDDGYSQERLWPADVLPFVLQFVDTTGQPGPKNWENGHLREDKRHHPVTGVSFYEANAYASWCGKRLPSSAEWQRAGTWWDTGVKYPWGNAFDPTIANTWSAGHDSTVAAGDYQGGSTPNGIGQLVGNVWEWVFTSIDSADVEGGTLYFEQVMGEVRGGAYDTYLPSQTSCLFRSAQPLLFRGGNVGFRCCVSAGIVQPRAGSISLGDEEVAE